MKVKFGEVKMKREHCSDCLHGALCDSDIKWDDRFTCNNYVSRDKFKKAMEATRCGECKYWIAYEDDILGDGFKEPYGEGECKLMIMEFCTTQDDFCSFGVPKDEKVSNA